MNRHRWLILLFLLLLPLTTVLAQETAELDLRLRRDFGSSLGGRIAGTFSVSINNPPVDVERVVFLIDGNPMGEDTAPPFRLQFRTGNYPIGIHTLTAIGYTADNREYPSSAIQRTFTASSDINGPLLWFIIPLILLSIVGPLVINWFVSRGNKGSKVPTGLLGGAICPNCGKPFSIHIWSPQFIGYRLDRCPHCGKWSRVTRASREALHAAQEAMAAQKESTPAADTEEDLRRRLDDSRYQD